MKIVKQGVDPTLIPMQGTCQNCRTVVEFLPSEAEYVSDFRDGSYWKIICPVCNHPILRGNASGNMYDR